MRHASTPAKFFFGGLTALALGATAAQEPTVSFEDACKALMDQEVPGGTVAAAQFVPEGKDGAASVPAHCKLHGKLNERRGIEAKKYAIGFELRLPKEWNTRFYFQGGGGTDGVLRPAVGAIPAGGLAPNALAGGYAVVSTDAGHLNEPGINGPYLFGVDPQARADYGYHHLPVVSAAAHALIERVYDAKATRSYFVGCSNGGRQAMMATQRFPQLFDGVIAAAPAHRAVEASLDAAAQTKLYAAIAPQQPNGRALLGGAFNSDELGVIATGILQACDALDGATDGMVNNVRDCKFDPATVQCSANRSTACLAREKAVALKQAFDGARTKDGKLIYAQWPYDPGIATPPQALNTTLVAGALSHVFLVPPKPTTDLYGFMLDVDLDAAWAKTRNATAPYLESGRSVVTADSPDIDAFTQRGGKIIFYHGMADGIFSSHDTVSYLQQLQKRYGAKADRFARLYLIPGMGHCSGGPATDQFDAVSALVEWVEKGTTPNELIAKTGANSAWPNRSRPLCPYPKQAIYSGTGDMESAASFNCK